MKNLHLKIRVLICVAVGLLTGGLYLTLISHENAYNAYMNALSFLPSIVIDFILPLIPPAIAGIVLGATRKEKLEFAYFGIAMVVILILFAFLFTARFGGMAPPQ